MKTLFNFLLAFTFIFVVILGNSFAQTNGDYRSVASGNWGTFPPGKLIMDPTG